MGFFRKRILEPLTQGPPIADGVPGQAHVVSSTSPHTAGAGQARYKTCHLHLVVRADGIAPTSVEHTQICPVAKWPRPGATIPVVVSRSDPRRLTIDFDQIPDAHDVGRAAAQQQAAFLRGEALPPPAPGLPGAVQIVGGRAEDLTTEQRATLQQLLGIDLGANDPEATTSTAPGDVTSGDDRLGRLERLAQLRATGALTDEEFAAEKRRLLEE